jgi:hypothetical protein
MASFPSNSSSNKPEAPLPAYRRQQGNAMAVLLGVANALLLIALSQGTISGVLVAYVPMLVLGGVGFTLGFHAALVTVCSTLMLLTLVTPTHAAIYAVSEAFPALLMLRLALTYVATRIPHPAGERMTIAPVFSAGFLIAAVCVYGCALLGLVAVWEVTQPVPVPLAPCKRRCPLRVRRPMQCAQRSLKLRLIPMCIWAVWRGHGFYHCMAL